MKFAETRAVITGGASGLGNAVARHVVARGGRVAMLDIQEGPGQTAAAELGPNASFFRPEPVLSVNLVLSFEF